MSRKATMQAFGWPARIELLMCVCLFGCASKNGAQQPAVLASAGTGTGAAGQAAGTDGTQPSLSGTAASAANSGAVSVAGNPAPPQAGNTGQAAAGSGAAGQGSRGAAGGGHGASGAAAEGGSGGAGSAAGPGQAASGGGGAAGSPAGGTGAAPGMLPIDPPVADDCITNVSAGDHTFTCQGLTFLVMVGENCTKFACGVIFDVHGAAMSGEIMRNNNQLHLLAPPKGYLVVHPNASSSTWDLAKDPPILADFMTRMIKAFHADQKRVHMTGFSMGSAMTFWFLCNHREALASVGPVTGASAEQVTVMETGAACVESIDAAWQPRVPILFMSGSMDNALTIMAARARTEGIVMRLGLSGGDQIDGDMTYTRKHWTGADGMVFDFLEHNYSNAILAGHCIPGGSSSDPLFACTSGGNSLNWGKTVLQWFIDHPKP
jgi:pimeloyl-ACP methyl ester carboxylesterase